MNKLTLGLMAAFICFLLLLGGLIGEHGLGMVGFFMMMLGGAIGFIFGVGFCLNMQKEMIK